MPVPGADRAARLGSMQSGAVLLFLALPWLNPFAMGPSPAVIPWLVTVASLAIVLLWAHQVRLADLAPGAWLAAALISAVLGLLQYCGLSSELAPWVDVTAAGEAFANLRQRNQFATLTSIGLACVLYWVAQRRGLTILAIAAAALLAVGNAASSSRTGMVQLLLLLALTFIWGGWRQSEPRRVALAAALAYGLAALLLPRLAGLDAHATGILVRLQTGDSVCGSRLTLWSNVLHLIAQKPWFGWGWGELDYAHFITLYPGVRFCDILDNAHNLPLHLAVELGLPFALLVCAGAIWLVWRARPWREQDATRQLAWTVIAVILLHSMLEYPLWYGPFQVAFGLSLWLLWRSGRAPAAQTAVARAIPYLSFLTAAVLLGGACYAAWDYHRISQIYLSPEQRSPAYRANTLAKIGDSWLFQNQVRFAQLTTMRLTRDNARVVHDQAAALLHFSPEPNVIEVLIESASLLGREDEVRFYLLRYRAAFPESHQRWVEKKLAQTATH
jgi:O-antigen ligase